MNNRKNLFLLMFAFTNSSFAAIELFPEIVSWKKAPVIEFENKSVAKLEKRLKLKTSFRVVTKLDDELVIKFSGGEVITVLPKSKVEVPQVSPDTGDVGEVIILEGLVRYKSAEIIDDRSKLRLKSGFFDLKIPASTDLIVDLNMSLPRAKIQVISGEIKAEFLDFEKKQILKSGDQIAFDGEKEGEQIKYDYLLDGRKSPHGVLGPVEKFDYNVFVQIEKDKVALEKIQLQKKLQEIELKKKKQKAYENSFLCKKPFGHNQECYWIKKNEQCFRYRCNVSGKWGDETERPMKKERCLPIAQVGVCDF